MKIACLGWGSLIWDPRKLKIDGHWNHDGPELPIEFTRRSNNGRITLIVDRKAQHQTTFWSTMIVEDLDEAIMSLQQRENAPNKNSIHFAHVTDLADEDEKATVVKWLSMKKIDAAIWTGISYNPQINNGERLSIDYVINYLKNIADEGIKQQAEEYVRRTPKQINTEYRRVIERELGWTHRD